MENKIKRPTSVWIAQILIVIACVPFSFAVLLSILTDVMYLAQTGPTVISVLGVAFFSVLKIGFILILVLAFWGLVKRKSYGRWLAIGVILLMVAFSVAGQILRPSGQLEYYEFKNHNELLGGVVATVVIYGLFALLVYSLAFGKNVKSFFLQPTATSASELPPPPVFTD